MPQTRQLERIHGTVACNIERAAVGSEPNRVRLSRIEGRHRGCRAVHIDVRVVFSGGHIYFVGLLVEFALDGHELKACLLDGYGLVAHQVLPARGMVQQVVAYRHRDGL